MRLRRLELVVVALTLAFACFIGGYFTGRRGAVNIVAVSSQDGQSQSIVLGVSANPGAGAAIPSTVPFVGEVTAGAADSGDVTDPGIEEAVAAHSPEVTPTAAPAVIDGKININTASRSELTDLPGIGNVLAERIVEYRQQNGPYSRIEDIRNVSGIAEKRFEAIQDRITVG